MDRSLQKPRPTQNMIAKRLGISIGAVSRALANDPKMAEKTRVLVRAAADEMGYTPDRAAQRLRTGRTLAIHLILPPHNEIFGFGNLLVSGISAGLEDTSYDLLVWPEKGGDHTMERLKHVVDLNLADGIVFSRTAPDDRRIRYLLEAGFPFVTHGRSEFATPHAFVDCDNRAFGKKAAEKLISRGAERLAILLPDAGLMFHHHLLHGFMDAVRAAGVGHKVVEGVALDSDAHQISAVVRSMLDAPDGPDGFVFPGDVSGLAGLAAIQDLGLIVGKDVHVVVKQTSGAFDLVRPRVDSLHEDLIGAGQALAKMIVKKIEGTPSSDLQLVQPISDVKTTSAWLTNQMPVDN